MQNREAECEAERASERAHREAKDQPVLVEVARVEQKGRLEIDDRREQQSSSWLGAELNCQRVDVDRRQSGGQCNERRTPESARVAAVQVDHKREKVRRQ